MSTAPSFQLKEPRIESHPKMAICGLADRHHVDTKNGIPEQWSRFIPWLGRIPGQVGRVCWAAVLAMDEGGNFDYFCGVEAEPSAGVPEGLVVVELQPQTYAKFRHDGHISEIQNVWQAVFSHGLKRTGLKPAGTPALERYGEEFDGATGLGGFEIWVPVQA